MLADLVQKQIAMNGSGVLDTGQVLGISKYTVTTVKKTGKFIKQVNKKYLLKQNAEKPLNVIICNVLSTVMDEIWSFYHDKSHQRYGGCGGQCIMPQISR